MGRYRRGVPTELPPLALAEPTDGVHQVDLDHAATTPTRPEARAALLAWLDAANASADHAEGRRARTAVEEARERSASLLGCSPHEVVFTSGGTEADNLAVTGAVWAARDRTRHVPHLLVSAIEHPAVLRTAEWLAGRGDCELDLIPVDAAGRVEVEHTLALLRPTTTLVSVMTANNELGTLQDVPALAAALAERDVPLHTDAVQAAATLPLEVATSGAAAVALSGHKFGAPQGVGAAVLRRGLAVEPLTHGGGQDRGVRSGTFPAALIAAFAAGLDAAANQQAALRASLQDATERLATALTCLDGVRRNGPLDPSQRLASHLHLSIDGVDPTALAFALDRAGLATAGGSACSSGAQRGSHVTRACGLRGAPLRLTTGWTTSEADLDRAIEVLTDVLPRLRRGATVLG